MIVSFTKFFYPSNHCSFEISLSKVLLFSKGLETYLLHSGVHSLPLKLSLFYLSLLNPPVTFVIEPQQTAPSLTLGGNSEQH